MVYTGDHPANGRFDPLPILVGRKATGAALPWDEIS